MNPAVLMPIYNTTAEQLRLCQQDLESVLSQDIGPLDIFLVDDGSLPETGTREWLAGLGDQVCGHTIHLHLEAANNGPLKAINSLLKSIFGPGSDCETVLAINSDVILPSNIYREMARWPEGIVSARVSYDLNFRRVEQATLLSKEAVLSPVTLIRKSAYQTLIDADGYFFDEQFFLYSSDNDLLYRMRLLGIKGAVLDIEHYHYESACHRLAKPEVASSIIDHAIKDAAYFVRKWGGPPRQETFNKPFGGCA